MANIPLEMAQAVIRREFELAVENLPLFECIELLEAMERNAEELSKGKNIDSIHEYMEDHDDAMIRSILALSLAISAVHTLLTAFTNYMKETDPKLLEDHGKAMAKFNSELLGAWMNSRDFFLDLEVWK